MATVPPANMPCMVWQAANAATQHYGQARPAPAAWLQQSIHCACSCPGCRHCHSLQHEDLGCMKVMKFSCPGVSDPQPQVCPGFKFPVPGTFA